MSDMLTNQNDSSENEYTFTNEEAKVECKKESRTFCASESFFAWVSLIAGYLFCRVFPVTINPMGGFIFTFLMFAVTIVVLKIKKVKIGVLPLLSALSALIISLSLIFSGNEFLNFFAYLYAITIYCYFIYSATGNVIKRGFSNLILADFLKALFILPFSSIHQLFRVVLTKKAGRKFSLKLIAGIIIAIIPTAFVVLLLSYDKSFFNLWTSIFDFSFTEIFSHIFSALFGIPIGMYIFGLFISSVDNKCQEILNVQSCEKVSQEFKIAPAVTALAATIPILFVYVIFFISQWQYYISGFTGILPKGFSYSQYAREGFFQLCAVSVINLIIIIAVMVFMKRKTKLSRIALKILSITYSVFTLILISTAVAKMVMYIDCYGLTQKRIYATWFMLVIAVIFIFILIKQIISKFRVIATSFCACVVLFAALSLSNVDVIIAKYNVNRYITGTLQNADIYAISELGDAAVPELIRLAEALEETNAKNKITKAERETYSQLTDELNNISKRFKKDDKGVFSVTVPYLKAKDAIEKWEK